MQDAEAPEENVVLAFKEVETAKQQKESEINNANQYRNEQIPAAEAKADAVVQKAEAEKTERENDAVNQVAKFNAQYQEYQKFPGITKRRMFYEAMQDILPTMKVIINDGKGDVQKIYPVESFQSFDSTDFNQNQEKLNENEKEAE